MSGAAARAMIERNPAKRGRDGRPGLTWRGDWKRSETYAPGDVVAFEGSAYVATTPTQGVKPPAGFDLVARKGDPGRDGQTPKFLGGGGPPLNIMDEGVAVGPVNTLNFVGSGIAASIRADGIGVVTASGGGASLTVKDEGSNLDTAVTSIDYTGAGVSATAVGHAVTVAVAGGGGGFSLLGPLNVAFANAGITDDPQTTVGLATIAQGSWVVSAWAVVRAAWDDGSESVVATLRLVMRSKTVASDTTALISYEVGGSDPSPYSRTKKVIHSEYPKTPTYSFPALAQVGDAWLAAVVDSGGAPGINAGDIDIYAFIVTTS